MFFDNKSAIKLSANPVFHAHMEIDCNFHQRESAVLERGENHHAWSSVPHHSRQLVYLLLSSRAMSETIAMAFFGALKAPPERSKRRIDNVRSYQTAFTPLGELTVREGSLLLTIKDLSILRSSPSSTIRLQVHFLPRSSFWLLVLPSSNRNL